MREKIARFMQGRNGTDQFNIFLMSLDIVLLIIAAIFSKSIGKFFYPVVFAILLYVYFRMFSRNIGMRRAENDKFIRLRYKLSAWYRVRKERWVQRKDYKFFSCPSCKTTLRVPRGHGKVKIVCRKCGTSFTGNT